MNDLSRSILFGLGNLSLFIGLTVLLPEVRALRRGAACLFILGGVCLIAWVITRVEGRG